MEKIVIYTDGGARGNPGPAGAGAVIVDGKENVLKRAAEYLGEQTNNWAEYEAVILGLKAAKRLFGSEKLKRMKVEIKLDSELVVSQLNRQYQVKEKTLYPQFIKVHNFLVQFPNISFAHIPREKNKEADFLANKAMDKEQ